MSTRLLEEHDTEQRIAATLLSSLLSRRCALSSQVSVWLDASGLAFAIGTHGDWNADERCNNYSCFPPE